MGNARRYALRLVFWVFIPIFGLMLVSLAPALITNAVRIAMLGAPPAIPIDNGQVIGEAGFFWWIEPFINILPWRLSAMWPESLTFLIATLVMAVAYYMICYLGDDRECGFDLIFGVAYVAFIMPFFGNREIIENILIAPVWGIGFLLMVAYLSGVIHKVHVLYGGPRCNYCTTP